MITHNIRKTPITARDQRLFRNTSAFKSPQVTAVASTITVSSTPRSFLFTTSTCPFSFGKGDGCVDGSGAFGL